MGNLLLGSILFVPFLIARHAAGIQRSRRGFRRLVVLAVAFNAVYALCAIYLFFRLV